MKMIIVYGQSDFQDRSYLNYSSGNRYSDMINCSFNGVKHTDSEVMEVDLNKSFSFIVPKVDCFDMDQIHHRSGYMTAEAK